MISKDVYDALTALVWGVISRDQPMVREAADRLMAEIAVEPAGKAGIPTLESTPYYPKSVKCSTSTVIDAEVKRKKHRPAWMG